MTIQVPEDMAEELRRWAALANEPEEEVVRRALASYLAIPPALREELEAWQQLGAEAIEKVAPLAHEAW
jgi:predicted transcriptional regulator